jgi:hypothetical protein
VNSVHPQRGLARASLRAIAGRPVPPTAPTRMDSSGARHGSGGGTWRAIQALTAGVYEMVAAYRGSPLLSGITHQGGLELGWNHPPECSPAQ